MRHLSRNVKLSSLGLTLDLSDFNLKDIITKSKFTIYNQEISPYIVKSIAEENIRKQLANDGNVYSELSWFSERQKYGYLLMRNCFSTTALPPTPCNDEAPDTSLWIEPASTLMALLGVTGHTVSSYLNEMQGRLAHMVMPAKNNEKSWVRSTKSLSPHTEVVNGHWSEMLPDDTQNQIIAPEVFALACLRNPIQAATTIWSLDDILNNLSYSTIEQLMRPEYIANSQSSFDVDSKIENVSVIGDINGRLVIRYSNSKLVGINDAANEALEKLRKHLSDPQYINKVVLQPGDILIINNRIALHGRDNLSGSANYDGNDRWLIRMYGFSHSSWKKLKHLPEKQHVVLA